MEDTIAILRGLESRYEVFHGVKITDNAIIAAATLSNRYITDRFLPDKAIDLIDEACAMIRTEMDSMPTELDVINRKIIQMEIEEAALKNEDDELSKGQLSELQKELAEQRDKFNTMKAQWENEKNAIGRVQQLREKIEQINREIETAQQNYDLEKAAKLMYGDLPEAKKQLEHEEKLAQNSKESSLLRNKVTEEEIAKIIIDLQIAALNRRLADKQLRCELTQAAKQFIIDAAYDPQFGARPLRRYVQHTVETLLAKRILRGDVIPGQPLTCGVENGELFIR